MKEILLTGGRPTGKLHLGHYVGAFKQFVNLQYDYESYFILSDIHMLTTKCSKADIATIKRNSINMIIDSIAMGVDVDNTTFYLQSNICELANIFIIFQNYVDYTRPLETPSFQEMKKHSSAGGASLGLVAYPVMEAGDIFALNADVVPVGKDNIDHIVIAQEIIKKMNTEFGSNFKIPNFLTDENTNYLVGINGSEKMSKSLDNAIYIRDDEKTIQNKIDQMIWDSDDLEQNVVVKYLKIFCDEYANIEDTKKYILNRSLSENVAKDALTSAIIDLILPMQKRAKPFIENEDRIVDILSKGTKKVEEIVQRQLIDLKSAMGLFNVK